MNEFVVTLNLVGWCEFFQKINGNSFLIFDAYFHDSLH